MRAKARRKGDKRERTRARLIEAAAQVIGEKGWDQTSLQDVATRAGVTRGSIYGNFRNRDELFLALVQARWKPIVPPPQPGQSFKAQMRALGRAVAAATPERRAQAVGALSFQLYALTHEDMRSRVARLNGEIYSRGAAAMAKSFNKRDLPMPPERLVKVLHALADGLTFLRFLTPELITDDVVIAAFEALAQWGADGRGNV
jgi:AcrR family transcriptional regulator